jgi:hypothetical protein
MGTMKPSGTTCCVVCGQSIDEEPIALAVRSVADPEETFGFWVHPECLKRVAKPGFVGLDKL